MKHGGAVPHRAAKQVRIDPMLRGFEVDEVNGAINRLVDPWLQHTSRILTRRAQRFRGHRE